MGLKSQDKTIGDSSYRVTQLPAGRARKLLVRLYKVLGPAFGKLLEGLDDQAQKLAGTGKAPSLGDVEMLSVSAAISTLALHLREEDLEYVVDQVLGSNSVEMSNGEGKWVRLTKETSDLHFAGRLDEMFRVLGFALEVNYSSFFSGPGGLGPIIEKFKTPMPSPSPSPEI